MNFDKIMQLIGRWGGTLKFFPSDADARFGIAEEISEMAANEDQVVWLVKRLPKIYHEWPGMAEVRAVFCSKFRPKDGIETYSTVYVDGIPSEKEPLALPPPPMRQLAAGEPVSGAESISATVSDLCRQKDMNRVLRGLPAPPVREIPVVRITEANRISLSDLERAREEYRNRKAAE